MKPKENKAEFAAEPKSVWFKRRLCVRRPFWEYSTKHVWDQVATSVVPTFHVLAGALKISDHFSYKDTKDLKTMLFSP